MDEDPDRSARSTCCARQMLASQPDFKEQKSLLEEVAARAKGVQVVFLPKFHCELNYIGKLSPLLSLIFPAEYLWGLSKAEVRARLDGTKATLLRVVPSSLYTCPLATIRRWYERMWKMVELYEQGLDGPLAAFAVKRHHGHRTIPKFVERELDTMRAEMERKACAACV
jgi:hypothetical protein